MGGFVSDFMGPVHMVMSMLGNIFSKITSFMNNTMFFQIIAFIIIIGKCLFAAFNFVI